MKVAILIPSLKKTAPNVIAYRLSICLRALGMSTTLFYLDKPKVNEETLSDDSAIHLSAVTLLRAFDIVHSHGLRPDIINYFFSRGKKVTTLHSVIRDDLAYKYGVKGILVSNIWRFVLNRFDLCFVTSNTIKDKYNKEGLDCVCVYNGVDQIKHCDNEIPFSFIELVKKIKRQNKIVVGTVSHLEKIKGLEQLLYLSSENKSIHVIIAGEGSYRGHLEDLVSRLNVKQQVTFLGNVKNGALYSRYFDVYVQPSYSEGFGVSVIESLINGTRTICSDIQVFKELFSNDEVVFYELNNIGSLNASINSSLQSELNEKTSLAISERFSMMKMATEYMSWYSKKNVK